MKLKNLKLVYRLEKRLKGIYFFTPVKNLLKSLRNFTFYLQGRFFFNKVLREKKPNEIYLILGKALGDSVNGLAYLDALHEKYPGKKIIVIGYESNACFLKTYKNIDELRLRSSNSVDVAYRFYYAHRLEEAIAENIFVTIHFFYNAVRNSHNQSVLFCLRNYIFKLPGNSKITYHKLEQKPVTLIKNFNAIKNKIVIVNPYSKMDDLCGLDIYEAICSELQERGYIVFTNIIGEQKAIKGTRALKCGLEEIYSIACNIPLIVSRRSGLLDFLIPSSINMYAIYMYNLGFYKYHRLNEWNSQGIISENLVDTAEAAASVPEKFSRFLDELKAEGRIS